MYKPLRTFIALVGLEIWSNRDLISVTPPAGSNLDAFMKWRNSELLKRKKHDNAHLIRYKWAEFYVNHARSTYLVMLFRIFWDVVMGFGFRGKSIQLSLSHVFLLRALVFITQSCFRKCTHLHVSVLAPKEVSPSCVCAYNLYNTGFDVSNSFLISESDMKEVQSGRNCTMFNNHER